MVKAAEEQSYLQMFDEADGDNYYCFRKSLIEGKYPSINESNKLAYNLYFCKKCSNKYKKTLNPSLNEEMICPTCETINTPSKVFPILKCVEFTCSSCNIEWEEHVRYLCPGRCPKCFRYTESFKEIEEKLEKATEKEAHILSLCNTCQQGYLLRT